MKRFGEKLRALRMRQNLTLAELANRLGYTAHGYISELEAGKKEPTAAFVLHTAEIFQVTTDQLLRDDLNIDAR